MASTNAPSKSQCRHLIEQAEGYIDLATTLSGPFAMDPSSLDALSALAMETLSRIKNPLGHKPYVLYLKGETQRISGRHEEAIHYFEQSRRIDPDNVLLCLALGWSYKRSNRLGEAIEAMKQAVEMDSESAIAHYNLACYLALDEHIESSLQHLSYAFDLDDHYRDMAMFEEDFDLIRSDPRFASMMTVSDLI